MAEFTPMMKQYFKIKEEYSDCILMYRLGDFYEMFFDDAKEASQILEITLTGRDCGQEERAPMCGVPFHAVDSYIAKLVENGKKVAICEQTEQPRLGQREMLRAEEHAQRANAEDKILAKVRNAAQGAVRQGGPKLLQHLQKTATFSIARAGRQRRLHEDQAQRQQGQDEPKTKFRISHKKLSTYV